MKGLIRISKNYLLSFLLLFFSGCKLGPNYLPPENTLSDEWSGLAIEEKLPVDNDPPPVFWWEIFRESLLNKYIQEAAYYNKELLQAEANILQARAMVGVSTAPLYPKVSVDLDAFHLFLSKNGPIEALEAMAGGGTTTTTSQIKQNLNIYNHFIDASWEIDLFGKTQRNIEASQAQLESTIEQKNDLMVSLFAEITKNYIELRASQKQKILLEKNVAALKNNVEILQRRYKNGYSTLLDLEQVNIQLNQALSSLPAAVSSIYTSIYALSVLTGNLPETLLEELLPIEPLPEIPESLSIGLRSELLRRRPDIREAERNLAQYTANIGVAVASFYPSLSLTGLFGLESLKIKKLFRPSSKSWVYGADINMPLFEGGKLIGNLKIAEAQAAASAFAYQEAVLNGLKDVEGAIVSYGEDLKTREELIKIVETNQRLLSLNHRRYTKGLVSKLDDLNSELTLNNAELTLLQTERALLLDLVTLYKALGGGWEPFRCDEKETSSSFISTLLSPQAI